MTRKESSLPFRSQIWFCSLSNKFIKKKKREREKKNHPVNCAHIIISHGFPDRYETPPGQPPSVKLEQGCAGRKTSLTGGSAKGPGAAVCVRPALPNRGAVHPIAASATASSTAGQRREGRSEVAAEKLLRKWLIVLKSPKSFHSFENTYTSSYRHCRCPHHRI